MSYVRWYDKNTRLKAVFDFIQGLDLPVQNEIAKDILQILMSDINLNLDARINEISKNYDYECKRWYDNNADLFSSFELIKNLPVELQNEVVKKIIESALLMYFGGEAINEAEREK